MMNVLPWQGASVSDAELRLALLRGVVEDVQPIVAPAFDASMVGKHLEVLWKYFDHGTKEPHLIWASGRVVRVAVGLSDKRSSRACKILPGGALLWRVEAAGEQWLMLLPCVPLTIWN
ncbi:hypothetical protein AB1Y20_000541 [Prymnesium parvum]|uniref:Uncharacterized protein n=1 Tax=Prymnesium parvum TaxID=97485 RepID=A0AB34K8L9_PRYPA